MIPLDAVLIFCWAVSFLLIVFGRSFKSPGLVAVGAIFVGAMTISTPMGLYISETLQRGGIFEATLFDIALVGVFGFLGGIIAGIGILRLPIGLEKKQPRGEKDWGA